MHARLEHRDAPARRVDPRRDPHPRARHASVEIARRCFAAFNRSVTHGAPDYYELLDPDVEWIPSTALLDGRAYRGPDDVRGWVDEVRHDWRVFEISWTEVRDLGDGRVLAFGAWDCLGRRSGVQLRFEGAAWLIELRDGKMARLQTFVDRAKAIAAAGLTAWSGSSRRTASPPSAEAPRSASSARGSGTPGA